MNKVKYLLTYRCAEIIHDLTVEFTKAYLLGHLSDLGNLKEKPKLIGNPQEDANFLLTLCHQETFLLDKQIKAAMEKFAKEGGLNEKLFAMR